MSNLLDTLDSVLIMGPGPLSGYPWEAQTGEGGWINQWRFHRWGCRSRFGSRGRSRRGQRRI